MQVKLYHLSYIDTPAEILARGPAALQAYIKASQSGTKPVYRTRLMLVGQERVGKTSLAKSITGQRYQNYIRLLRPSVSWVID